jgi:hypothetical protein
MSTPSGSRTRWRMARLGLGRADAPQAQSAQGADAAKGADPDITVLKAAKAEYAKLK